MIPSSMSFTRFANDCSLTLTVIYKSSWPVFANAKPLPAACCGRRRRGYRSRIRASQTVAADPLRGPLNLHVRALNDWLKIAEQSRLLQETVPRYLSKFDTTRSGEDTRAKDGSQRSSDSPPPQRERVHDKSSRGLIPAGASRGSGGDALSPVLADPLYDGTSCSEPRGSVEPWSPGRGWRSS